MDGVSALWQNRDLAETAGFHPEDRYHNVFIGSGLAAVAGVALR